MITSLLAIDPGQHTGWALFRWWAGLNGDVNKWYLDGCGVVDPNTSIGTGNPDLVVIENPQIYPNQLEKKESILKLARLVGRYEERFRAARIELVRPHQWKGSIDGDIMVARIEAQMTSGEAQVAARYRGGYRHNMIDAIGLGKWALRMLPVLKVRAPSPAPSPQASQSGPPPR